MLIDHMEKLKYFFEIARLGSISQAAKMVNLTQPSLTKSLKVLEEDLQKQLFIRTPKGMTLTTEGQKLYESCLSIFSILEQTQISLAGETEIEGVIQIGTYESVAIYFWPFFIKEFRQKYPRLKIQLTTDRSLRIEELVAEGTCDLGLIIDPVGSKFTEVTKIGEDEFDYYICYNKQDRVFNELSQAPLILMNDFMRYSDKKIQETLKNYKEQDNLYETNSIESAKALCENGIGIAILPNQVAKGLVQSKKLKKAQTKLPSLNCTKHHLSLITSRYKLPSTKMDILMSELLLYTKKFFI